MSDEAHSPPRAGPDAGAVSVDQPTQPTPSVDPTPVVSPSEGSRRHPPGTADTDSGPAAVAARATDTFNQTASERPEVLVGGAFAGGFVVALILKRLGR